MKRQKFLDAVFAVLLAAVFLAIPLSACGLYNYLQGFGIFAEQFIAQASQFTLLPAPPERLSLPVTCLVFGIDAGEWAGGAYRPGRGRADSIMLVRVSADGAAALLSIPRDTLVEIPGRAGEDKINHAYAFGQTELLIAAVERFTGVRVDCYLGLNYRAFIDIVDLLGGVDYEVDRVITAYGIRLEKGLRELDGRAAFAVVTTRDDPLGDIDRIKRQQRFIRAVLQKAKSRPLDDIFYMTLAAWRSLDTDLEFADAVALMSGLPGLSQEDLKMAIVPGRFYNRGGISYWKPDRLATGLLLDELFSGGAAKGVSPAEGD